MQNLSRKLAVFGWVGLFSASVQAEEMIIDFWKVVDAKIVCVDEAGTRTPVTKPEDCQSKKAVLDRVSNGAFYLQGGRYFADIQQFSEPGKGDFARPHLMIDSAQEIPAVLRMSAQLSKQIGPGTATTQVELLVDSPERFGKAWLFCYDPKRKSAFDYVNLLKTFSEPGTVAEVLPPPPKPVIITNKGTPTATRKVIESFRCSVQIFDEANNRIRHRVDLLAERILKKEDTRRLRTDRVLSAFDPYANGGELRAELGQIGQVLVSFDNYTPETKSADLRAEYWISTAGKTSKDPSTSRIAAEGQATNVKLGEGEVLRFQLRDAKGALIDRFLQVSCEAL